MRKRYILVLTAIILCLIFSLTGCGKKTYQAGTFFSIYSGFAPMIGIKADTDKFATDNVTFDFYCGLYDINNNESLKGQHGLGAKHLNLVFVIYARRAESANFLSAEDIDDYRNIDGWYYNILRTAKYDGYIDLNYEFLSNDEIKIYYEWAVKIL